MKQKKKESKHTTVRTYVDVKQKLNYLAKANSQSVPKFLEELINELFPLCGEFTEVKLLYEGRLDTRTLNIMFCPKATYEMPIEPIKRILRKVEITKPIAPLKILVPSKDTKHMQDIEIVKNEEVEKND